MKIASFGRFWRFSIKFLFISNFTQQNSNQGHRIAQYNFIPLSASNEWWKNAWFPNPCQQCMKEICSFSLIEFNDDVFSEYLSPFLACFDVSFYQSIQIFSFVNEISRWFYSIDGLAILKGPCVYPVYFNGLSQYLAVFEGFDHLVLFFIEKAWVCQIMHL